ncbi:serine palmitoyltransferase [Paragonimus westermani]|uniref:serine C-palmitoyltransferase n=1 Tax=Paragonimus westermani TaxID=34504 RepID=A0A5J4P3Y8_9TREM|nr:serine palmitoyltransferase [Paragonimus westermani]
MKNKYRGPYSGEPLFEQFAETPLSTAIFTYVGFMLLNLLGRLQDFLRWCHILHCPIVSEPKRTQSFVPLYSSYEAFYTRNLYRRVQDCWNRPICSSPGVEMVVMDRVSKDNGWTLEFTGTKRRVLNLGSYNYLGFGDPTGPSIKANERATRLFGVGIASSRQEVGNLILHRELEELVAEFVGQEDAIVFSMGFATNSLNLPCLVDQDCCVVSDELNHTSLVLGCRLSGAVIRRFKHNDMEDLERVLEDAVVYGRPRTHRPYKKILIVVEGVYSMEGSIVHLPEVIALKKKYKAYLYLDEAHSIGALGPHGRGVVDYFNLNPREIDISMGTFTKSFGSAGGYLAGSKRLIDYLRSCSHSAVYGGGMPAPVTQQIISAMRVIMGREVPGEGQRRIQQLAANTRYFRARLHAMRLIVYGNRDSPVVPVIISMPAKLVALSRKCLDLGLGTVIVGFPATSLLLSRVRFCISSMHTREMLDKALTILEQVTSELHLRNCELPVPDWAQLLLAKECGRCEATNGIAVDRRPVKNKPPSRTSGLRYNAGCINGTTDSNSISKLMMLCTTDDAVVTVKNRCIKA